MTPACQSGSFFAGGVVCSAKFVLYIAFSPFSPQDVILEFRFASKPSKFCGSSRRNATRDGAKPPQAGSTENLMYLAKSKELFYHKGCKFALVGVDQTLRRPLAVLLSEIAVEDKAAPKTSGQFRKAKLRRARKKVSIVATTTTFRACSG